MRNPSYLEKQFAGIFHPVAWPGVTYETSLFRKCLFSSFSKKKSDFMEWKEPVASEVRTQNSLSTMFRRLKPKKWCFMKSALIYCEIQTNICCDKIIITRESICGHFRHSGLGSGAIWGRFFEQMLVLGRSYFWKLLLSQPGSLWGISARK